MYQNCIMITHFDIKIYVSIKAHKHTCGVFWIIYEEVVKHTTMLRCFFIFYYFVLIFLFCAKNYTNIKVFPLFV